MDNLITDNIKDAITMINDECENALSIPYYAWGDNEAATSFAHSLKNIHEIVFRIGNEIGLSENNT